ncbi:ATP-binding protein [Gryllotalpicola reticulitermitis]|uniref:ATP-binding protein n=1 Tax=Gryllotalpicola reticulitermitis TaxID=1184153 RepID=A0ABV8Q651_9MICO
MSARRGPAVLAERVVAAVAELCVARPVVLIDGPSGAGKSTLADAVIAAWPALDRAGSPIAAPPQLVRLDDLYPGWGGLSAGSRHVADDLLAPLTRTGIGRWRAWDWAAGRPGAWHEVSAQRPLVVEGCGALSRAAARHADLAVWLTADDDLRRRRALERDRGAFDAHWQMWDEQFTRFTRTQHPIALADLRLAAGA